jgi:hypothetical protein
MATTTKGGKVELVLGHQLGLFKQSVVRKMDIQSPATDETLRLHFFAWAPGSSNGELRSKQPSEG